MVQKNLREIPLAALKVGMTVVKMDISWLDSPFLTHTRRIKSNQDLLALEQAGVRQVTIDLDKSDLSVQPIKQPSEAPTDRSGRSCDERAPATGDCTPLDQQQAVLPEGEKNALKRELKIAADISRQVKEAVLDIHKRLESNLPIRTDELYPLLDTTLASLERNNQALLSLVHLSRKAQKLTDHVFGCFCLVLNLALEQRLDVSEREVLGLAALLHEVGWNQLPLQLMGKRKPYTPAEKRLVQSHVELGRRILAPSKLAEDVMRVIAEHHELGDGSGYPQGLKSNQTHKLSQLLALADTYEERVHHLTDRPGMTSTTAMRSIYVDAEKGLYDKALAASFISMLGIYPVLSAVKLNTGELAIIREAHHNAPLQPTVEIHYSSSHKPYSPPLTVDLRSQSVDQPNRAIECAVDPHDASLDPFRRLLPEESALM